MKPKARRHQFTKRRNAKPPRSPGRKGRKEKELAPFFQCAIDPEFEEMFEEPLKFESLQDT